jgi:hypothetical protein
MGPDRSIADNFSAEGRAQSAGENAHRNREHGRPGRRRPSDRCALWVRHDRAGMVASDGAQPAARSVASTIERARDSYGSCALDDDRQLEHKGGTLSREVLHAKASAIDNRRAEVAVSSSRRAQISARAWSAGCGSCRTMRARHVVTRRSCPRPETLLRPVMMDPCSPSRDSRISHPSALTRALPDGDLRLGFVRAPGYDAE